jgi:hypothetical protein
MIEYRVCWTASSNITFKGSSGWQEWEGFEDNIEDVENAIWAGELYNCPINLPYGLHSALEASGFDWWAEVREA